MEIEGPAETLPIRPASREQTISVKRRKLRKGTFSCWECKRRKRRCERDLDSSVCLSCKQHGVPCISQDLPDVDQTKSDHDSPDIGRRVEQVEALVNQLIRQRQGRTTETQHSEQPSGRPLAKISKRWEPPTLRSIGHERLSRGSSLSGYLLSLLPHPHTSIVILSSSALFSSPLQMSQKQKEPRLAMRTSSLPTDLHPAAHPVLFARRFIQLALCLKQFDASSSKRLESDLKNSIRDASQKYHEIASRLVLSQDFLVNSLDGIETMILQARYHVTVGNIHTAWEIQRRAINIARTIGSHQLTNTEAKRAKHIKFQLIYSDRFICLKLGTPFTTLNEEISSENVIPGSFTPLEEMERLHVAMAERIITRNFQLQGEKFSQREIGLNYYDSSSGHYHETKAIDDCLKKAAKILPPSWWLVSSREDRDTVTDLLERTGKLLVQLHQYYLIILLHQPYIIQLLTGEFDPRSPEDGLGLTYSKLAATSASREALSRYINIRELHRSPTYRLVDEKGYISATTLLFGHIVGHRDGSANVLEHQRLHDLGLITESMRLMEKASIDNKDTRGLFLVETTRKLLKIEDDAAEGSVYYSWNDETTKVDDQDSRIYEEGSLSLFVPYFGNVHLSRHNREGLHTNHESQVSEVFSHNENRENASWFEDWIQLDTEFQTN